MQQTQEHKAMTGRVEAKSYSLVERQIGILYLLQEEVGKGNNHLRTVIHYYDCRGSTTKEINKEIGAGYIIGECSGVQQDT